MSITPHNPSDPSANASANPAPHKLPLPTSELPPLHPQDLALIELLDAERFNIRALLNKVNPIHPVQRSLVTLTQWAKQPHIRATLDAIMEAHQALWAKADAQAHIVARESLTHALAMAASMIPHFDTCPDDPDKAEEFAKRAEFYIRETRSLARTLLKLSPPPPPPPSSRRSRSAASPSSHLTDPDTSESTTSASHASSSSTSSDSESPLPPRGSPGRVAALKMRFSRNARKPTFSPAEVAEILSALLEHEEDINSRLKKPTPAKTSPPPDPSSPPDTAPQNPSESHPPSA